MEGRLTGTPLDPTVNGGTSLPIRIQRRLETMWLFRYRELLKLLTLADLKLRYRSSVIGFAWTLLNPLLMMVILYLVFHNVFGMKENDFALYLLIGIVAWRFLANGTVCSMGAIVQKSSLVTKLFIPRQILVLSSVLSCFISSALEFLVLVFLLFFFGIEPTAYLFYLPLVHVVYFFMVYGISLALSSLYVYYRDLQQIWEVLLQAGFFLSPVVYPLSIVPPEILGPYLMNPFTATMQIFRQLLLYGQPPAPGGVISMVCAAGTLLGIGSLVFVRLQRRFAEEL